MTTALIPSLVDDQLAELDSYDIQEAVGETPEAAIRAAEGLGLHGWPRSASREPGGLWVHRYTRPKEACHA